MVKNKLYICRDYHLQPSEIDRVPFYEYEMWIENINQIQKEEEKRREMEEKQQSRYDPSRYMSSMSRSMSSSMSNIGSSMPNFSIPKF